MERYLKKSHQLRLENNKVELRLLQVLGNFNEF